MPDGPVLTLPNALSLLRLAGIPLFLWLVLGPEADAWALVVLMVSGVTDYLDGYLARRLNQFSPLGEILDPVADRLYILAVVVGLALRDVIPWWVALLLPARDLFLWGLVPFLRTRGYSSLPVHFLGKAATFNLLYAFPLLLLGDGHGLLSTLANIWGWAFAVWGIGLYWWAGLLYAWQVYRLLHEPVVPLDWDGTVTGELPVIRDPEPEAAAPVDDADGADRPTGRAPAPPTPPSTPAPQRRSAAVAERPVTDDGVAAPPGVTEPPPVRDAPAAPAGEPSLPLLQGSSALEELGYVEPSAPGRRIRRDVQEPDPTATDQQPAQPYVGRRRAEPRDG